MVNVLFSPKNQGKHPALYFPRPHLTRHILEQNASSSKNKKDKFVQNQYIAFPVSFTLFRLCEQIYKLKINEQLLYTYVIAKN